MGVKAYLIMKIMLYIIITNKRDKVVFNVMIQLWIVVSNKGVE